MDKNARIITSIIEHIENNWEDGKQKENALSVFDTGRRILLVIEIKSAIEELHRRGIQAYEAIGLPYERITELGIDDFNDDIS